jgi:hypothetical protein
MDRLLASLVVAPLAVACGSVAGSDPGQPDAEAEAEDEADGGTRPTPPPDEVEPYMLIDSLRGSTEGNLLGGELTPAGWRVTSRTDRIWFPLPNLYEGSIEFTVTGISNGTDGNMILSDHEIFSMYEAGYGMAEPIAYFNDFRNNYSKVNVRIFGAARSGEQKLVWDNCAAGAPGYSDDAVCPCGNGFSGEDRGGVTTWTGGPERFRIEWNYQTGARLLRNGFEVVALDWSSQSTVFAPTELHFSLGSPRATAIAEAGLPIGAVFSDVVVDGMVGSWQSVCSAP